jgi:hypothetical protein
VALGVAVLVGEGVTLDVMVRVGVGVRDGVAVEVTVGAGVAVGGRGVEVKVGSISIVTGGVGVVTGVVLHAASNPARMLTTTRLEVRPIVLSPSPENHLRHCTTQTKPFDISALPSIGYAPFV